MEVGLEVNAEKVKYMFMCRQQNVWQNRNIKTPSKCFGNVTKFRYLEETLTEQNWESWDFRSDVVEDSIVLGSEP
jgi:hypothetical protein